MKQIVMDLTAVIVTYFKAYACRGSDYLTGCDTVHFLQDYMVSHFDSETENSIFPRLPDHTLSQPRILHYEHPPA
jgi:hypothetical protein